MRINTEQQALYSLPHQLDTKYSVQKRQVNGWQQQRTAAAAATG
jgi:hypothetical protein